MAAARAQDPTPMEASLLEAASGRGGDVSSAARDAFAARGLPHRRIEDWRWTDLRAVLRDPLVFAGANDVGAPAPSTIDAFVVAVRGGEATWDGEPPAGVTLTRVAGAAVHDLLAEHPTAIAATALSHAGLAVHIADGVSIDRPIVFDFSTAGAQQHARVLLHVGSGASASVVERHAASGGAFVNTTLESTVEAGAALERYVFQEADGASVQCAVAGVALGEGARLRQHLLLTGGKLVRMETRLDYQGAGVEAEIGGAALIAGGAHADATTWIAHNAPGCRTRQTHRSVVRDRGRSVFQGKFLVNRAAQQTDADMQAAALLLEDGAEANHKPELEIYADDVACAHGATAGALDAAALFYLRQRGLSAEAARALLIEAFVAEAFDGVARDDVAAAYAAGVAAWLSAGGAA
ncbi:MAG: Fe-S cluster assembly protein SufD [Pseudomonadota bacterium]